MEKPLNPRDPRPVPATGVIDKVLQQLINTAIQAGHPPPQEIIDRWAPRSQEPCVLPKPPLTHL